MSDDDLDPPHDDSEEFHQQFEIIVRPRPSSRLRPSPLPPPQTPRTALAPPLVPFPDPIPHIMPHGSISTLSGASGVGKTCWLAGLIKAFQTGQPINGHPTHMPSAIGFISVDRPYRDHKVWFDRAQCAPFSYYSMREDEDLNWEQLREYKRVPAMFAAALDKLNLPPGALVIVDPLPLLIAGKIIDYKDAAIGMALIDKALRARQLTLLGVFHVGKEKGNKNDRYLRPQDRILGSGGQVGYSETAMYLMSPVETGQAFYTIGWVPHQIPEESFKLQRDAQGLFQPFDDLTAYQAQQEDTDRALTCFTSETIHVAAWLIERICAACDCKERHAKELISLLCQAGKVERVSRGNYRRVAPPSPATGTAPG